MKQIGIAIFIFYTIALMPGCVSYLPVERSSIENDLPSTYSTQGPEADLQNRWWEGFNNPELTGLIELALRGNLSLQASWARLNQVQALAVKAGAASMPDLSIDGGASVGRRRTANGQTRTTGVENYSVGLLSNYELDLWGRIRSEKEAAMLASLATREDLNAAATTLAASVTERWIQIISQRMQKELLEYQLEVSRTLLELVELRFHNSLASALDVFQQRSVVARSEAQIPLVEQAEQLLLNELALLLGKPPQTAPSILTTKLAVPLDVPAIGLPAQLLIARPDVRAAVMRLEQSDWLVKVAKADRLPQIRLTGRAGYQSEKFSLILDNWLLNLAANITAPLFDGQRRQAEEQRALALVDENLAAYRRTIITAIKEVEDALVSEMKLRTHIEGLEVELSQTQSALDEARSRYGQGLNDYLPVLTELLAVQNLERDLIRRKADLLIARVNLYRALGGTWTDSLEVSYHVEFLGRTCPANSIRKF